jgi:hypothetical protein
MQVVEVNHVILHHLRSGDEVSDNTRVVGNLDIERVLNSADAGQSMHHGADTTDALGPDPGFAGIAVAYDQLDSTEHRAGAPGVRDLFPIHLRFNPQVAFDAAYRVDNQA